MRPKKEYTLEQFQNDKKLLLKKVREMAVLHQLCSIQMVQRAFKISYAESRKVIEKLKLDDEISKFIIKPQNRGI